MENNGILGDIKEKPHSFLPWSYTLLKASSFGCCQEEKSQPGTKLAWREFSSEQPQQLELGLVSEVWPQGLSPSTP